MLVVIAATMAVPVFAADGDRVTYGAESIPSWHVTVENGSLSTLDSWANASEDRAVLRTHNDSNYALIKAPESAAGESLLARLLNRGLAHKSYVVSVRPNLEHSLADPVRIENESAIGRPKTIAARLADVGAGSWNPNGIAYGEDVDRSLPRDIRDVVGVDNISVTGNGSTIAVVDTGVNTANGAVFGNGTDGSNIRLLNASKDFIENETVTDNGTSAVDDPNGHGTWVASAAAANHSNDAFDGIAPEADVLALRALAEDGSGTAGDIAAAIRYANDNGAHVIVLSLGSPVYDQTIVDALEYALADNVTAAAVAAGNSRQTTRWLSSPADAPLDGVAAVAASNTSVNTTAEVAYFSNVGGDPGADGSLGKTAGEDVTVAAPGTQIVAKAPTESGGVQNSTLSGTSMAAPQVAGVAALGIDDGEPWVRDPAAFVDDLRQTARPMPRAAQAEAGAGLVAADRLLTDDTDGSQEDAMTTAAAARDAYWTRYGGLADRLNIPRDIVDRVLN